MEGKNREVIIIVASVVIIILVAYLAIGPAVSSLKKSNLTIKTKGADLKLAEENLENLKSLKTTIETKKDQINALIAAMPSYIDSEDLITSLEAMANKNGMQLTGVAPVNAGVTTATEEEEVMTEEGAIEEETGGMGGISEAQYDVTLRGSYQALQKFMADLEANRRPINVTKITITKETAGEAGSLLNITLGMTTYYTAIKT